MNQRSEVSRYEGQDFPCHGVILQQWGVHSLFQPWAFNGFVVVYAGHYATRSEAMHIARELLQN